MSRCREGMENNTCDINHLDADVLLPPRKRLLAGLKRQNSDVIPSAPSTCSNGSEFDTRMNNLLKSHLSNPNLSNEEIVDASRLAAIETAKAAQAARAVAVEKAAKAAKAVAAAKSALELVATISEETANKDKYLKKNKMKKHVPVQTLYNKHRGSYNCRTDEELARKLHRAINSSPRISKNTSPTSDSKKHKKLKCASSSGKAAENHGVTASRGTADNHGAISLGGTRSSTNNGNGMGGNVDQDCTLEKTYMARVDLNVPKFSKSDVLKMDSGEASKANKSDHLNMANREVETVVLNEKDGEEDDSGISKKRGRIKQKKLPLSICNSRDQVSPKEDLKHKRLPSIEDSRSNAVSPNKSLFSVGSSADSVIPVERTTSIWKCQSFKAPACVKQNKVMQS